ncbi:aminoglycoside phosphotransferase [Kribbella flavida DSM 17836]|uniref:Aminoglycoside phosphotransferase n=1 Tax=Kribbella flavida (strain DSM 17836 / JCM 10339 / NBRC 14399) TaxID=479435 RepID=D2Q2K5_KRIFD|nr:phosphotransferase family protein [Kribbella flavida]ADB30186.1 aminoglycoside phosphotransferase [Kribbella flavida DSM 17836]
MTPDQLRSRLAAYFARRSSEQPPPALGPLVKLAGGWASSLYTFTLEEAGSGPAATAVLKMYAPNARGGEHAAREWGALNRLRAMDLSVPRGILHEADARHLGQPFMVMDHISGSSLWQVFQAADSGTQARLTESFVAQLVALHALDAQVLEPAVRTHPYGYIEHELEQLRRDSESHAPLVEVVNWLEKRKHTVPCERPVILHRDYHPWNVLVDGGERLWVIDWDWQIGDARFDLAWTCMLMQRSDFRLFSSAVRAEYAQQSGGPLDGLTYFEVLTTVRWLLNVLPAVESEDLLDAATRADFRKFLVDPVRRAQTFLHEQTGIDAALRM